MSPAALALLAPVSSLPADAGLGPEVYHVWPSLTADLAALAAGHPMLAKWSSAGKSVLGLDLWVLEIANFAQLDGSEPVVVLDGGHHGNEQLGMEAVYAVAVRLLNDYALNATIQRVVDDVHLYLVPSVNPDGTLENKRKNAHGVDLNRNYPWHWGEAGCSHDPNSPVYCGPSAASEPEVRAMLPLLGAAEPDIYISMHTGTTMLIHSWGWTRSPPPDGSLYDNVGAKFRALTGIVTGQASTTLYTTSGSSKDWAYGTLGALSWTFEVHGEQGSLLSVQDIEKRLARPLLGLYWVLQNAARFGAIVGLAEASVARNPDGGFQVGFALRNTGFGPALVSASLANGGAPLVLEGPSQALVTVPAEDAAQARFTLRPTGDGSGSLTLTPGYARTALLGEPVQVQGSYTAVVSGGGQSLTITPA